jgi:type I restriction enzyme S subunit
MTDQTPGWIRATVGELLQIRYGKALPKSERDAAGPVPVIGSAGRMTGTHTALVTTPAVLVGRKGSAGAVQLEFDGCWPIDTTYYAEVPATCDPRFLRWQLHALDLGRLDSSTTTPSLRREDLEAQPIVVPPLDEQHRIVDLLEDHLSRLDATERGLSVSGRSTAAFVRSALAHGLRGQLVENDLGEGSAEDALGFRPSFERRDGDRVWAVPNGWLWARIGDVFEVNVGATPSRGDASLWAGDLPWVSSGEVTFSRIGQTREHITRDAAGNPARRIHPPGTVMLAMIGEGKTRGQAAILDIEAAHNQNCASIRVSATNVLPEYVYGYLEERYLETRRAGSGGQQQALNKAAIQRFPIPIPPLATQRRLVSAWDEIRSSAARLGAGVARASQRSESLRRALLAAAFSGRLSA